MAKRKQKKEETKKNLASVGFEENEKPKTQEQLEIERLLGLGKVNAKHKN